VDLQGHSSDSQTDDEGADTIRERTKKTSKSSQNSSQYDPQDCDFPDPDIDITCINLGDADEEVKELSNPGMNINTSSIIDLE
jgi:hypothetical protein